MNSHCARKHPVLTRSALALAVACSTQALAQGTGQLEEVIVTAEHREATLQETQISLSAFSTDAIQELGISNGLDISEMTPNLNAQPYVGGRTGIGFTVRGIGNSETLITFDPAVSVYLDGILIAKNTGSLIDVLDMERVEVLRGPQGTLYGRNTMGGAVNFITRKPTDEFEGYVKGTVGNYGRADLRAMVNAPLLGADSRAGELNLKLSGGWLNRDGIQDNDYELAPQDELGTVDREAYSVQLQWKPTESFSALYMFDRTEIDEVPETVWTTGTNPNPALLGPVLAPWAVDGEESPRPDSVEIEHVQIADTTVEGHSLTLDWQLSDNLALQSLTGYRDMDNYGEADSDGTPFRAIDTRDVQEYESFSQEFRLLGSLLEGRLDYTAGLFYIEEEGDLFNETVLLGDGSANIADYTNEAWAIYGQGTYDFTDALNLTLGARYTEEDREMEKTLLTGTGVNPPLFLDDVRNDPALAGSIYPKAQDDFDNVSWLVSLGYNFSEDVMSYAKISTGYQSGGFNARDIRPEDFVVGFFEEELLSYELGLKATFNDRFQVNAAIFFSDYDDKRVNQFDPVNLVSIQRNAGKVEIWGAELEFLAQLSDHWRAGFNYGYTDKEYKEYLGKSGEDLSGVSNFPYSPDNMASANLSYDYQLNFGLLRARVDWSYRDEMTFLTPKPERNSSGDLQLWNARVSLDDIQSFGDTRLRVSVWGKNLTDEGYFDFGVNIYDTFGFDINTFGAPRTYGLDVELMF